MHGHAGECIDGSVRAGTITSIEPCGADACNCRHTANHNDRRTATVPRTWRTLKRRTSRRRIEAEVKPRAAHTVHGRGCGAPLSIICSRPAAAKPVCSMSDDCRNRISFAVATIEWNRLHIDDRFGELDQCNVVRAKVAPERMKNHATWREHSAPDRY